MIQLHRLCTVKGLNRNKYFRSLICETYRFNKWTEYLLKNYLFKAFETISLTWLREQKSNKVVK
jgi:hypothetical protein